MYANYEKIRDSLGYTNYSVSKATGISQMTLSDWKRGRSTPKRDKLEKIAELFEVPVEYIITGEMPTYYTNEETAKIVIRNMTRLQ